MRPRYRTHATAFTLLSLGLLATAPALGASLQQVAKNEWASGVPSYVQMHVYVPDKLATKPPIVVSVHSCGSTASGQMGSITRVQAAADKNGFILILPDNPGQNCWDVGSNNSLKHDGGGDTQAVAQMVRYALTKYSGDASRVYIFGGSSGGMMTQAMLAVYPDLFRAGSARAGVPAGCWAVQYNQCGTQQWSCPCANGDVTHTAQEWGDLVRAMYPAFTGARPRVQLIQGGADTTISSKNMPESVKEWTNVLGLSAEPTSKDTGFKGQVANYDRQIWENDCGLPVLESWVAPGKNHSMGYEEDAILKFFGLDVAVGGPDPADACSGGTGGSGGSGGMDSGGAAGASGAGAAAGQATSSSGGGTPSTGSGGAGTPSSGGSSTAVQGGSGGSSASPAPSGEGGVVGVAGASTTGGSYAAGSGGSSGSAPLPSGAGAPQPNAGPGDSSADSDSGGCSFIAERRRGRSAFAALLLGFGWLFYRRGRSRARS